MTEYYVWHRRYRYYGSKMKHKSTKMFPVSYGPFDSQEQAQAWIDWRGITHSEIKTERCGENILITDMP